MAFMVPNRYKSAPRTFAPRRPFDTVPALKNFTMGEEGSPPLSGAGASQTKPSPYSPANISPTQTAGPYQYGGPSMRELSDAEAKQLIYQPPPPTPDRNPMPADGVGAAPRARAFGMPGGMRGFRIV